MNKKKLRPKLQLFDPSTSYHLNNLKKSLLYFLKNVFYIPWTKIITNYFSAESSNSYYKTSELLTSVQTIPPFIILILKLVHSKG